MFRGFEKQGPADRPSAEVVNLATFRRTKAKAERSRLPGTLADHGWYHQSAIDKANGEPPPVKPS